MTMTTCDSAWISVAIAAAGLLGLVGWPMVYCAHRARFAQARLWLAIGGAVALAAAAVILSVTWGLGYPQLLALAFLPAALGSAYAIARPDALHIRAAFLAAWVSFAILVLIVGGIAVDAAIGEPCPGVEVG